MHVLLNLVSILALLINPQDPATANGSISGRVTVDGKPAAGITLVARQMTRRDAGDDASREAIYKAKTDYDGRYNLSGLPKGQYIVVASSGGLVRAGNKEIVITDDDKTGTADFQLSRGGVITGRVTDSEGRPLIAERITIAQAGEPATNSGNSLSLADSMFLTDDRGVFRIYGLEPGRYLVSAGTSHEQAALDILSRRRKQPLTYYPGVGDKARARPVDVTAGAEATGIDIRIVPGDKGYAVSGRVIDADSGAPIQNALVAYGNSSDRDSDDKDADDDDDLVWDNLGGVAAVNARGEFRLDSVQPGRYTARVEMLSQLTGTADHYGDSVTFEVRSTDVDGIVIRMQRGASISGVVSVEDFNGGAPAELPSVMVVGSATYADSSRSSVNTSVQPDGIFRLGGLRPGRIRLIAQAGFGDGALLKTLRVERDGVEQPDGIDVQPKEQVTGVRIVMARASGVIKGHAVIQGKLPSGYNLIVLARRPGQSGSSFESMSSVDHKGNFTISQLIPGPYEIELTVRDGQTNTISASAKQNVVVDAGTPAELTLTLDIRGKQ